jgi:hypothetical protein
LCQLHDDEFLASIRISIQCRWADGFQLPPTPFLFVRDPAISDVKADVLRYGGGNIVAAFGFSFAQLSRTPQVVQL